MKKYFREWIFSFLSLHQSEQRGIIVFVILTLILVSVNQALPLFFHDEPTDQDHFLAQIEAFKAANRSYTDSIEIVKLQNAGKLNYEKASQILQPFPFDPNKIDETKWTAMGLTQKQAASISKYLDKGGEFRQKEDLKKIYLISEGEYKVLEPFIRINEKIISNESLQKPLIQENKKRDFIPVEINAADSALLVQSLDIAPWLAARLLKFRDLLGGFVNREQLFDVYGFDSAEVRKRWDFIRIDTSTVVKLHLNKAPFKTLLRHPYLSYDMVKQIASLRKDTTINFHLLLKREVLTADECTKLRPYLMP